MSHPIQIPLLESAVRAVRAGHPWVYRDAFAHPASRLHPGDIVDLVDPRATFIGRAMVDPTSTLFARVLTLEPGERIDLSFVERRLQSAFALRKPYLENHQIDAYRLCYGEGDRLPGLVLDRYAQNVIVRADGEAATVWARSLLPFFLEQLQPHGVHTVALRIKGDTTTEKILETHGNPLPEIVMIHEYGMHMEVNLWRGQKTGAFLDQRENRYRIRRFATGRRVLNLFSYTGGFSLAAALGGSVQVTSVDLAHAAHGTAQRSFRANGLDPKEHSFVTADAFSFLDTAQLKKQQWDLIISDPPSFAPNEKAKPNALSAYRRLHRACAQVLSPGGILCAASCSSHISDQEFLSTLDGRSLGRTDLRLCEFFGLPWDHPTLPIWKEGRYLKFAILA